MPITIQSGKHRSVQRRLACDHTMRRVWTWFAFNTVQVDDCWAREDYQAKRKTGGEHFTVLRGIADRWIKITYRCWCDRKPYNEAFHQKNRAARAKPKVQK